MSEKLLSSNKKNPQNEDPAEVEDLKQSILRQLRVNLARSKDRASNQEVWTAVCLAVREKIMEQYMKTQNAHLAVDARRVHYLSLEYLMGRLLNANLCNLGFRPAVDKALMDLGFKLEDLCEEEHDMGLGNGGLGRLAACFLDSMATMDLPAIGYGIHYQYGLFKQEFKDGRQIEKPDDWRRFGNPWEIARPEFIQRVKLYGHVEHNYDDKGNYRPLWVDARVVDGLPFDVAVVGYEGKTVNFLRLWESKASEEFDLDVFNQGGYVEAVREKATVETISKVLYPNDETENGKELRLVQQYFFVSCSLRDIISRYRRTHQGWDAFSDKVVVQLNDTHPAVAILELLRILVDEEEMPWDESWEIVKRTFAYTNHTLLPEALETWSEGLFSKVLPRHYDLVLEVNRRFLHDEVDTIFPDDIEKRNRMAIVSNGQIRMAHLSVVGSHSVNGVAALHTKLLKEKLLNDFAKLYPSRFNNKTNGITPRRWLIGCNPRLAELIESRIGPSWVRNASLLRELEKHADDISFQEEFRSIKAQNKQALCNTIKQNFNLELNPEALFDVQIKRLHEYKRQHLNLLHILTLYRRLLQDPDLVIPPRVFVFGAKAAPGYHMAKVIIHAINLVAQKINADSRINNMIKVFFWPNYGVSAAEQIIPASDLSEQISTAGKEASGTGNMKFALNGALTMGTLDGANVEILEEVGPENIFIFGQTVEGVEKLRKDGYDPFSYYESDEELKAVLDWMSSDFFCPGKGGLIADLTKGLLDWGDPYLVLADYRSYIDAQERAGEAYLDSVNWSSMAIRNVSGSGKFSSDRTIAQYAKEVWKLDPVKVP